MKALLGRWRERSKEQKGNRSSITALGNKVFIVFERLFLFKALGNMKYERARTEREKRPLCCSKFIIYLLFLLTHPGSEASDQIAAGRSLVSVSAMRA